VDKSILEAVLGLWMLHYRDKTAPHESPQFLDIKRETYERWIQRQAEDTDDPGRINNWSGCIFGEPITEDSSNLVKVISHAPINNICGQYILSKFMSEVAEKYLVSIGGRVWIRSGQPGVKASFGWGNTVLDDLANELERTGLATIEEAFLGIVPPLEKAKKLPTDIDISAAFLDTTKQMATYLDGGRDEQAKRLHLWVLDAAESHASWYESGSNWKDACGVYAHLCYTYDNIKGGEDFVCAAEEFMGLFCERLFISYSTCPEKNHQALTNTLDLVRATLPDAVNTETWIGRLLKWKTRLQTWNRDIEELPANNLNSLQTLLNASHSGNCLCLARLLELRDLDIDTTDSEGRTALILATIAGHATIVSLLLQRKVESDVQDNDSSHLGADQTKPYATAGPSGLVESLVQDNNKRTAFHYAAINGYTPILHTLLRYTQTPHKIDIKDVFDKSPMDLAIENNQAAAVSLLIFYGVGCDAMHTAAREGNDATIRLLHACGANIQLKSSDRQLTALHLAFETGQKATVELLVNLGASIQTVDNNNLNALHRAAQNGYDSTVQLLLDRGANIQAPCRDNNGTALHFACQNGHTSTVRLLLKYGANIHAPCRDDNWTALHLACQNGHTDTVRLLLEYGANIEAMARGNFTVLHLAADRGHTDVVRLLLDSSANISISTQWTNRTALHLAAAKGREDTVRLLISRGAKIETTDVDNRAALHSAAENGQQGIVRLLLDYRANIEATCTICNDDNGTALHLAAQNGHEAVVLLLLDHNADIEAASRDNQWTALHLAAGNGHVHIVRQLLDHGANRDRKGGNDVSLAVPPSGSGITASMPINNGRTALELAQVNRHDAIVQLLGSHHAITPP
jgi:ankyrin repeat protein